MNQPIRNVELCWLTPITVTLQMLGNWRRVIVVTTVKLMMMPLVVNVEMINIPFDLTRTVIAGIGWLFFLFPSEIGQRSDPTQQQPVRAIQTHDSCSIRP
jgi:hypothetical protein